MLENLPSSLEKPSKGRAPSMLSLASSMLREIAEPRPVGDTIKLAIARAARAVSSHLPEPMSYARAENLWRGEARRIDAAEMDAIRAAHAARAKSLRQEIQQAQALVDQLEALAASVTAGRPRRSDLEFRKAADEARKMAHTLRQIALENSEA
ncbi:hypothetical protein [Methylobacterium soli]|uniref:hypothetical protein n=1 Tax=Methylobacterium soli TaxID=553447 RepID=UPI001EE19D7E|nr:hypothetical protein [Methylobacterium soli]